MKLKMSRRGLLGMLAAFLPWCASAEDDRPVVDDSKEPVEHASSLPCLWIAGDSTVKSGGGMRGWGQELGEFLDSSKITVVNRAVGGRSSRTFFNEGRWNEVLKDLKAGDLVLIQFGHNDVGPLDERSKFRGSVKGVGDETVTMTKPDGSEEVVHSYGWYLRHFARTAKAKGATVVLCSPVPHKRFDRQGEFVHDWEGWNEWVKSCAAAEGVKFLDLAGIIGRKYAAMDPAEVEMLFADKGTHTNAAGARLNAVCVIAGMKSIPEAPLDRFLNGDGRSVKAD